MDNNEIYVNEVISSYLDTKEEMKALDEVTVKSLFRTCIESVNPELPHSSVIIKGIKNPENAYSVKLKNIKLNLNFALDMILGVGEVLEGSKLMLIFLVLDVLRKFFSNATEKIEEKDAYLVYLIHKIDYSKTGVSKETLEEYIKKDSLVQKKKYFEKEDMEESLKRLENIQSIVLEDGCYHITETILN
uniref:hypothetical protein n=1 Tax=Lachnospira eligens TaxID=39485 RepID=UPI004027001E